MVLGPVPSTKWSYETAMNNKNIKVAATIMSASAIALASGATPAPAAAATSTLLRPAPRRHTPLASVATDKAAVIRSTGRLTDGNGWTSKKPITFDAAI